MTDAESIVGGSSGRVARTREAVRLGRDAVRLVWRAGGRDFAFIAALQVTAGIGSGASVFLLQWLLSSTGSVGGLAPGFVAMMGLWLVLSGLQAFQVERRRVLSELVTRQTTDRVLELATSVDLIRYEDPTFHDRLRRAQMQGQFRSLQLTDGIVGFLGGLLGALSVLIALSVIAPVLLPIILLGFVPLWFLAARNGRDLYEFDFGQTANDRERAYLQQLLATRGPAKEMRAFNLAEPLRARYGALYEERLVALRAVAGKRMRRSLVGSLSSSAGLVLGMGTIAFLYLHQSIPSGSAFAAVFALFQFTTRLQSVFSSGAALYEGLLFVRDYDWISSFEIRQSSGASAPTSFDEISVVDLSFTYPASTSPALDAVSLTIRAGEVIALVGENGSGKTTLAKIIAGLYRPQQGAIYWDNIDVATVSQGGLRESIALIFQDFEQYRLPAAHNIGFGRHALLDDRERIVAAATAVAADPFLCELPSAYDTQLGTEFTGGVDLSIGQWQRVALARAVFRDAPLVILDEPTAALDPRAERELFSQMNELMKDRTVVLISHRFSSVRSADRIYVLDRGRVIESGTHRGLMELSGRYAELFTLQAASYLDGAPAAPTRSTSRRGEPAVFESVSTPI